MIISGQPQFLLLVVLVAVLPVVVHLAFMRFFRCCTSPARRQIGIAVSSLAGLLFLFAGLAGSALLTEAQDSWFTMDLLYLIFIYLASAYVYFHFFNMSETARRIRIIVSGETAQHPRQVQSSVEQDIEGMISRRLQRLVSLRELTVKEGRYRIGRGLLLIPSRLMAFFRQAIFPDTAEERGPSWLATLLVLAAAIILALIEHSGLRAILSPSAAWIPFTLLGAGIGTAAFLMLSPRPCLKNFLLVSAPFLFVTFGFITADGLPGKDSYYYHFPFFQLVAEAMANGYGAPTWFPLEGGSDIGFYHINNFPFLPHRLAGYAIFALFPVSLETAYKIQLVLGVLLFSWGWYAVIAHLTRSQPAAFMGTLCIMLGGTGITFHQEQVIATCHLLPWFTLCLLRIREKSAWIVPAGALFALGLSTHYPQIQLISMGMVTVTILLWQRPSLGNIALIARRYAPLLALLLLLGSLPSLNLWYHSGELAAAGRDMAHLRPTSYEEFYQMNKVQYSSSPPWYFRQYLLPLESAESGKPGEEGEGRDAFGMFVGRVPLLLSGVALILSPFMAAPVAILSALFADLTLGINSHLGMPRLLFETRFPFIDVFRQWYHFYPFLNLCLSLLAGLGFQQLFSRGAGGSSPLRKYVMLALVFITCADLARYDFIYLQTWPPKSHPLTIDRIIAEGPINRIALFQYRDRYELTNRYVYAIPPFSFVTTGFHATSAGIESERQLAIELSQQRQVITNLPGELASTREDVEPYMAMATGKTFPWGISYLVDSPTRAMLVSSVNYALGTKAFIDGIPAQIWRVNSALGGVMIEKGKHDILFKKEGGIYQAIVTMQTLMYLFIVLVMICLL